MNTIHRLSIGAAPPRTLGRIFLAGVLCWSGVPLFGQNQPPTPLPQAQPGSRALLTQEDLKEMVGPIALYPDALIALILPASTVPSDVVLGARFVEAKGDPAQAGNQPWDESIKSLVYYPDVLSWMNENLEWTASLGEAFMDQPADVMNAIQSLRAQARASGALTDTPQQKVIVQEETIRIIPADPEVIYVPQYEPEVVFVETYTPSYQPIISFGIGFAVGSWLNYDCDWRNRYVCRGDWVGWNRRDWDRGGWNRGGDVFINNSNTNVNVVNINSTNATRWNPGARSVRQLENRQRGGGGNARFATAEARAAREMIRAERRQNNGRLPADVQAVARRDDLPRPARLERREGENNLTARPQDRTNRNDTAGNLAEARRVRENATPNRPVVEDRRRRPSEAPRVNGQLEAARQTRMEEARRGSNQTPQNVRQPRQDRQVERPNQAPTRPPRVDDSTVPPQGPSVTEPQRGNRANVPRQDRPDRTQQPQEQQVRQPRSERPQAQERPQRPQPQQEPPQVRQPQRPAQQEARPQRQERPQRPPQEMRQQRVQQPQPQQSRQRPENRSAPQPRQQPPQQRAERPQPRQEAQPQQQRPQRQEVRQERPRPENRPPDRPQRGGGGGERKERNKKD